MKATIFTIIDIEYTGVNAYKGNMVELALVKHDGKAVIEKYHVIIKPKVPISDFLMTVFRFSKETLGAAPMFEVLAGKIFKFIKGTILVGLNIRIIYALLKKELKEASFTLREKQLCLSQLIDKSFPSDHPKTLTSVCQELNIPFEIKGDLDKKVAALAIIFEQLFLKKQTDSSSQTINKLAINPKYPPNLPIEKIATLSNVTGVYYFLDQRGKVLYLGKSKRIRQRIMTHFNTDLLSPQKRKMKASIFDIRYTVTGSELLALLLESDEIKRYMPTFNQAQRRQKYPFGLYVIRGKTGGYDHLKIDYIQSDKLPLMKFSTKWKAVRFVLRVAMEYQLNLELCGISSFENSFEKLGLTQSYFYKLLKKESVSQHNGKVKKLIEYYSYQQKNMLIVEQGREEGEYAFVLIEDNQYKGYGYVLEKDFVDFRSSKKTDLIRKSIIPFKENPDVQRIIRGYLRRNIDNGKLELLFF